MTSRLPALRRVCGVAFLLAALPTLVAAQRAFLPLDDVAYAYIDALQARGMLRELPMVERPYTVGAVRRAIAAARTTDRGAGVTRWLDAIEAAMVKYAAEDAAEAFTANIGVQATSQTSGQRDLLRADERDAAFAPGFTVRALLEAGPVTVAMRTLGDRRLRYDPDFRGRQDRILSGRTEDAYVAMSGRYVQASIGRVARSWGLPGQLGLQLSQAPYTYDHAWLRLGTDKVHLSTIVARLNDDFTTFNPFDSTQAQRWFTAHRVGLRLGSVDLGLTESIIYGGAGQGFDFELSNPAALIGLAQVSGSKRFNMNYGVDALWRAPRGMLVGGQLLVDDFQIDDCELCREPPSLGGVLTIEGIPVTGSVRAFASYVRVNALTYRAERRWESYTSVGVGLGHWVSDFDEARLGLDLGPVLPLPVRGYVAYRRQGQGNYLQPYPQPQEWATWPTIFEGTVARTLRVGMTGSARLARGVELSGDLGVNSVRNADFTAGRARSGFEGRIRLALESRALRTRVGLGAP